MFRVVMLQANHHRVMGSSNHANDEYDFEDDDNMSPNESEESDEGEKLNNIELYSIEIC